ncbi:MAG: Na+/H+ antiporter subunit E [Natronospirillum sp.]
MPIRDEVQQPLPPRRWLPHPMVSLVLVIVWQILAESPSLGSLVMGLFLGWFLPWLTQRLWAFPVQIRGWVPLVRYAFLVLWDITMSNIAMLRHTLGPIRNLQPAFFEVPLDLTNPIAITVLANTITLTPGTVSADVSPARDKILVHGLHVPDIAAAIADIKGRYEAPLKEIL